MAFCCVLIIRLSGVELLLMSLWFYDSVDLQRRGLRFNSNWPLFFLMISSTLWDEMLDKCSKWNKNWSCQKEGHMKNCGNIAVAKFVERQCIKWFCHVVRIASTFLIVRAYNMKIETSRGRRGKPRMRWIQGLADTLQLDNTHHLHIPSNTVCTILGPNHQQSSSARHK